MLGGETESIVERLEESYRESWPLSEALQAAVAALAGPERVLEGAGLEVAILADGTGRRAFRRSTGDELAALLL